MAKFRKRPVIIEAEQYLVGEAVRGKVIPGVCSCENPGIAAVLVLAEVTWSTEGDGYPHCHTLEGPLHVSNGDWVICGTKGEYYPCKPDVFAQIYEPVDDI